jgi:ribonuclease P/MRP protein subunit POP1
MVLSWSSRICCNCAATLKATDPRPDGKWPCSGLYPHSPYLSPSYLTGARRMDTHIYKTSTYPFGLIAPISLIWKPLPQSKPEAKKSGEPSKKEKGKKKAISSDSPIQFDDEIPRTVWLQCHPSGYETIFSALQDAASTILHEMKRANQGSSAAVEIVDLRERFNVFDIVGPKASQVVRGALSPIPQELSDRKEFNKAFNSQHLSIRL